MLKDSKPRRTAPGISDEEIADLKALSPDSPRVEECITAVMKRFPGQSPAAQARYFEAVHQELGPLARQLEAENVVLRMQLFHAWEELDRARNPPAVLDDSDNGSEQHEP